MATAPIMDKADIKKLLNASKKEPVHCAIVLGKDGTPAILMHKTKQPRALLQELEKSVPGAKNPCFGSALVDMDEDPKLAIITVNKAPGGLARRLRKTLKGTGFTKVELRLEDGSVAESAAEEDEEEGAENGAQADTSADAPADTAASATGTEEAAPADLSASHKAMADLIPRIPVSAGTDAAKLDTLKKLAAAANAAIKNEDAAGAAAAVAALRKEMGGADQEPRKDGEFVTMQKSRLIWDSARKKVGGEIVALKKAVSDAFDGDPEENAVLDALTQLDTILQRFDTRLIDALDDLMQATDPAKRAELRDDAKELIDDYTQYANSNPLVKKLDGDTPFGIKLSIGTTMTATLKALQASLH